MGATPSARIVAVEPGQPGFVTLTVLCPLCGRRHEHGTRAKGGSVRRAAGAEPRRAVRTWRSPTKDRARGYRLADPDCLILGLDEAGLRSS